MTSISALTFYATMPHTCSYLAGQSAATLLADPQAAINTPLYSMLIDYGFRRSGERVYRPRCAHCQACIPVRVPVATFKPSRIQRRVWRRNHDLDVQCVAPLRSDEHFDLYQRYLAQRHASGGMDDPDPDSYLAFLASPHIDTGFYEFRLHGQLLAVAVVDHLQQGLSAVYTFFDPQHAQRSLGVYAVLWQIEHAKRLNLTWLYLGYWIKESPKMNYKEHYRPLEMYQRGQWVMVLPDVDVSSTISR